MWVSMDLALTLVTVSLSPTTTIGNSYVELRDVEALQREIAQQRDNEGKKLIILKIINLSLWGREKK